jgi:hypothetical protein
MKNSGQMAIENSADMHWGDFAVGFHEGPRSAAEAASGPVTAARTPLVAAAARAASGKDGKGRLAARRHLGARHSEAC